LNTEHQKQHDLEVSELRYRRLFETAQDGILILNADSGDITDVNPFLLKILGYAKEEIIGKKLWEIGSFKDVAASKQAFATLQSKEYVRYKNLPLQTKSGRLTQVEFISNVYLVGDERVVQCNIRDITETFKAKQKVLRIQKRLKKLNAELEKRIDKKTSELSTANTQLLEQLAQRERDAESLRSLSSKLLNSQEEERRSIARELHDEVGQNLTVLKLVLGRTKLKAPEEMKPALDEVSQIVSEVLKQVRHLSMSLRPGVLDELGLVMALESLFSDLNSRAGLQVHFESQDLGRLSPDTSIAIYRIAQESLTNVMRHGETKEAWVRLWTQNGRLHLSVADKGRGFDPDSRIASRSVGLLAMAERATLAGGVCTIESKPGKGTTVKVDVPLYT
jgi:PAS domain S-box-containing protein